MGEDEIEVSFEEQDEAAMLSTSVTAPRRWIALPRTLRLSTRPRPPLNPDGTRSRTFARISKSGGMPSLISNLSLDVDSLAERLVEENLMPLFQKLHPENSGWNLSLVNICATNLSLIADDGKSGIGRNIGRMFNRQEEVLREWKIADVDVAPSNDRLLSEECLDHQGSDTVKAPIPSHATPTPEILTEKGTINSYLLDSEDNMQCVEGLCKVCGAIVPPFAVIAHERFHALPD